MLKSNYFLDTALQGAHMNRPSYMTEFIHKIIHIKSPKFIHKYNVLIQNFMGTSESPSVLCYGSSTTNKEVKM